MLKSITAPKLSVKAQIVYSIMAMAFAVILPQLLHLAGRATGIGTALGEIFLPMHLPVMLVGLLAGPFAGALAGLMSPVISFALTGMPSPMLLPFMIIELFTYGLAMGLMKNLHIPTVGKVFITQLAGRLVRAAAILMAVYLFKNSAINVSVIWLSIANGVLGIILQLVLIPLITRKI